MYGSQNSAAAFDLGLDKDALASQLNEEEERRKRRLSMTGIGSLDPAANAAMSLGLTPGI